MHQPACPWLQNECDDNLSRILNHLKYTLQYNADKINEVHKTIIEQTRTKLNKLEKVENQEFEIQEIIYLDGAKMI